MGIPDREKYLLMASTVAVVPALLAEAMAAAGFRRNPPPLMNRRSKKARIDQDKLELKKKVDESLRRLENEKLITKNGSQFVFLTNEEQDVNREIREISIERSVIIDKVGNELLYTLFGTNSKYTYDDRHDFAFNTIIDDRPRGQQREEIGIRILTPYYAYGNDPSTTELSMLSMHENNVLVVLPNDMSFLDEMEQALQIN